MEKIRVLIADDHAVVRLGLRTVFQSQPDIDVVGEADSGEEAIRMTTELHPNLVLMDITMPGMGGIAATRRIRATEPDTYVLVLTMHKDEEYSHAVLGAGASGYLLKGADFSELLYAMRHIPEGETFFPPPAPPPVYHDPRTSSASDN